jgi:Tol biopolymer transport system component
MLRVHREFIVLRYTESYADSRKRAEMLYRVAFEGANLIKMSLVTAAAMLAICVLALVLVEPTKKAEAKDSLPENGKIAFSRVNSGYVHLYTVEPDGSNPRLLTPGSNPKWSPDGTELLFESGTETAVMSADGSNMRIISNARHDEDDPTWPFGAYPTWSADGTSVAWSNTRLDIEKGESSDNDIFMVDLDNLNQTNLRKTPKFDETYAAFSPDGSQICFTHLDPSLASGISPGIYVMDVKRSDPILLFQDFSQGNCDWSPDGKKIVFSATTYYQGKSRKAELDEYDVYIINADGSGLTALTNNPAADVNPDWSPDGTKIVFSSDRDGGDSDIYTMDADGSDITQVTNTRVDAYEPDWQPLTAKSRSMTVHPPDTGGLSLLLVASALLFSGGVMFYAGLKRRV